MQPEPIPDATITALLGQIRLGSASAADELARLVYVELRAIAEAQLRGWRSGTLTPTAVVNSAFERLLSRNGLEAENRRHFFFIFRRAIADVVSEYARRNGAQKRGGHLQREAWVEVLQRGGETAVELTDLHDALEVLRTNDDAAATVVQLRFFVGMTLEQAAETMGCTLSEVRGHWAYARAWLLERLSHQSAEPGENL